MLKSGIAAGIPLNFYAFNIFEKDGEELTNKPLADAFEIASSISQGTGELH